MEEARLLELQGRVYEKSGNVEETLKTLTRAKEVQTRWTTMIYKYAVLFSHFDSLLLMIY